MKEIKFAIFLAVISLFAFRIWQTSGCKNFNSFYFNPLSVKISVESQVGVDISSGLDRNVSRVFHNKVSSSTFEFFKAYAATFNSKFLLELLGPAGLILVILSFLRIVSKKQLLLILNLIIILIISAISISKINPRTSFYLLGASWYGFSLWSVEKFLHTKIFVLLLVILVFFSFWYFIFNWQMPTICNEIFFN